MALDEDGNWTEDAMPDTPTTLSDEDRVRIQVDIDNAVSVLGNVAYECEQGGFPVAGALIELAEVTLGHAATNLRTGEHPDIRFG